MRITESALRKIIRETILLTEGVTVDEAEATAKKAFRKQSKESFGRWRKMGSL